MAFTVTRPGGATHSEFEAYVRLLEKSGVDRVNTPRTPEPETGSRWLPVWSKLEDAERFAEQLRKATKSKPWHVVELDRHAVSAGPLGPLELYMSELSDGCAYGLHPHSRNLVLKKFPQAHMRPVYSSARNESPTKKSCGRIQPGRKWRVF